MSCYHDITFIPKGTQVSRLGTEPFILMEFLLATALTCADVSEMIDRVNVNNTVNAQSKQEIVEIFQIDLTEAVGLECTWDAKVD